MNVPQDLEIPPSDQRVPPPGYRVSRRPTVDPGTRRLALIAAGIGGVLIVVLGLWSMLGGRTTGVPVVTAPSSAMRVKPTNPGGMQVAGTTTPILTGNQASGAATLAPAPEKPDLAALESPPPAPAAPSPAPTSPAAPTASAAPRAAPVEAAPVPPPAAPAALAQAATPAPRVAANGLPLPPPQPPPLRFASLAPVRPPIGATAGTGRATEVQLAALSSEDAANREWRNLQAAFPALFGQRQPLITKVKVDGHTFWRLRTGGFANVAAATEFCANVKAKGKSCTIASF